MQPIPSGENREVLAPTMGFEAYRTYCDDLSGSYRKVGVLDEEKYQAALQDPTTELIQTEHGRAPLLVSSEYVGGYDVERTKKLTGKNKLYLLSVPAEAITEEIELAGDYTDAAIVVETDSRVTADAKSKLSELLSGDVGFEPKDFIDERIDEKDTEHRPAWMAAYAAPLISINREQFGSYGSIDEAFTATGTSLRPEDGHVLYNSVTLEENPDIVEDLWDLFKDRFGWLGDFHPVSMEDTKEMFIGLLLDKSTYVTVRYHDSKLLCGGVFMHGFDGIEEIIGKRFLRRLEEDGQQRDLQPMYFPGVAARQTTEALAAMDGVVKFHCEMANKAGIEYLLMFESSNMSSTYIPDITKRYIDSSGYLAVDGEIERVGKLDYWYLASTA